MECIIYYYYLKNNLFNKLEKEEEIDVSKRYLPGGLSYSFMIEVCFHCGFVVSRHLKQNFEFGIERGFLIVIFFYVLLLRFGKPQCFSWSFFLSSFYLFINLLFYFCRYFS